MLRSQKGNWESEHAFEACRISSGVKTADVHYIPGLNHSQRSQYIRNQRLQIFKTVTAGSQYHKPNHHRVQILLVTNSLVHSDKNFEFRLCKSYQRPIDGAGP